MKTNLLILTVAILCTRCTMELKTRLPKDFVWHTVTAQEDLGMIALRYYDNPKAGFIFLQEVNWDRLARGQPVPGEPAVGMRLMVPSKADFQQWLREGPKSRIPSRDQTLERSADALLFPDDLSGAAERTYANYVAGINAGKETASGPQPDIPSRYWSASLKALNPIRIYTHQHNVVVVQRVRNGMEEGKYIYIPISSNLPQTGDDGFEFSPNPRAKAGQYVLGDGIFDFKRSLRTCAVFSPLAPAVTPLLDAEVGGLFAKIEKGEKIDLAKLYQALNASQTTLRAYAARELRKYGDKSSVPYLIDALSDESSHVGAKYPDAGMATTRYWANDSLKRLTAKDFGFTWNDAIEKRNQAITNWREWYERNP
jgi:hypothetical protein